MLEANPEIAKTINQPDSFGITDLQRAARSGNMEMMSLLLSYCAEEEIKVNPEAFFTTGDLEACEAPSELEKVDSIDIEKIAFPLTVIQNYCSVMVGLADGKVLQIRNADAKQVRDMLMQKKYGPEWKSDQGANVLTMFLSPGHGFLRLQCQKCDDNKPYNMNSGFYPKGQKLAESRILFLERQRQALREQQIDKPLESGKETDGQFYPGNVLIEAINMMKGMRFFI